MYYMGMGGRSRPSSPLYIGTGGDRSRFTARVNIWTLSKQLFLESVEHWPLSGGGRDPTSTRMQRALFLLTMHETSRGRQIISGSNKHQNYCFRKHSTATTATCWDRYTFSADSKRMDDVTHELAGSDRKTTSQWKTYYQNKLTRLG